MKPFYKANIDLTDAKEVEGCQIGVSDGEYTYYTSNEKMYRDSLTTGTTGTILTTTDGARPDIRCITDKYILHFGRTDGNR